MNTNELISYVQKIYEIEKNIYMQNHFLNELQNKRSRLMSWIPERPIMEHPINDERASQLFRDSDLGSDSKGVIWGFLSGILAWVLTVKIKGGFWSIILGFFIGYIVFCLIANLITGIISIKEKIIFNEGLKNLNDDIEKNNAEDKKEVERRINSLDTQISECSKNLNNTQNILNKFYSKDIIFEKYRNIYAISSICEYLKSGRCDSLTGTNGAYNLYEAELRQGIIINKLDEIISRLDRIEQNQYLLYEAINETNRSVNQLMKTTNAAILELQNLKDNVEICAYNSSIIAQNERFQSALMTYATINQIENTNYI